MDVLFLAHRIPYPPNKGDKIRSWHILRHLAERARVHLGCFIDDPADMQHQDTLRSVIGGEACFVPISPLACKVRGLKGLMDGESITASYYPRQPLAKWAQDIAQRHGVERVFLYSSAMFPFATPLIRPGRRVVMDFVDMDSDKWRQYAQSKRWPMSALYRREAVKVLGLERTAAYRSDVSLFVTDAEVASFKAVAGSAAHDVRALFNGVDHEKFSPDAPFEPVSLPGAPNLVFTGAMDYWANVDAVVWFADEVLPKVRAALPETHFTIVGARPTAEVQKLARRPGITVTGTVDDVRPYIAAASMAVAPLRIARGVQNKVLEAMAMAKAVVTTPAAAQGIAATPGKEFLVGATAQSVADAVVSLAQDPQRAAAMGREARRLVLDRYDWGRSLSLLDDLLDLTPQRQAGPAVVPLSRASGGDAA
ncbi:TIGR03087 family PEP-CTERM/XrtA system glycosyltransferase [Pedomonas mirosovicensis]|uniref:TIGR03087 family PEP-CTERM/XrtA system glycosyltransferase n=1 Tax=Pedomonas mirosovicensis TaxID=2908641 RepID=UPI0021696EE6|nr:TIGR03087 family PEP-CTERM/XrtA system glycosyltransferase [Pedomonas mirosovicensis]MCH8684322.1 TIGR03087 family PEP-CTERM/XrtA system glycosyltransferase [Pedomonas mirosovicensis]